MSDEHNPFLRRQQAKNGGRPLSQAQRHAPKQEAALARKLGGRVTPGSGNGAVKGDVRVRGALRIECKCTRNKSFSVTREMMEKITNAGGLDEVPVLTVQFLDDQGNPESTLFIMDEVSFSQLVSRNDS